MQACLNVFSLLFFVIIPCNDPCHPSKSSIWPFTQKCSIWHHVVIGCDRLETQLTKKAVFGEKHEDRRSILEAEYL